MSPYNVILPQSFLIFLDRMTHTCVSGSGQSDSYQRLMLFLCQIISPRRRLKLLGPPQHILKPGDSNMREQIITRVMLCRPFNSTNDGYWQYKTYKSNKIKENSNTVRHLNNGTDHRHSKSCCDQSSPARRTMNIHQSNPRLKKIIYIFFKEMHLKKKSYHAFENDHQVVNNFAKIC